MKVEMSFDPMELEPSAGDFRPAADTRPHLPEPPQVRLIAVEDVRLPATAGLEARLDQFYVGSLRFERELTDDGSLVYKSETFRLHIEIIERLTERRDFRPLQIEVPTLAEIEAQLIEREIEYERQKGLDVGDTSLVLLDPAGNWVSISEIKSVAT